MANLKDIVAYLLEVYPVKWELSNARVTKMVYLADWHQAIKHNCQISPVKWYFDNYGPFVWDIYNEVKDDSSLFWCKETSNPYGEPNILLGIKKSYFTPQITDNEKESLNHVIAETKNLDWDRFIRLIYSTFPIISSERYNHLNLVEKARTYNNQNA